VELLFLGTGAGELWPSLFCPCNACRDAVRARGVERRIGACLLVDRTFLFDLPPNANLAGNPAEAVSILAHRLMTLHISDNDGLKDLHALPFDGNIDGPAFMAALEKAHYSGVLMMEVRGGADYDMTLRNVAERFKRLLECCPR